MKKYSTMLVLSLLFSVLPSNFLVLAETGLQEIETVASQENKALFPSALADKAQNTADLVSREDLIAALVHCLEEVPDEEAFFDLPFLDKERVTPALRGYLASAYRLQIFSGTTTEEGLLSYPMERATKQEAAALLGKALGLYSVRETGYDDENEIAPWALPYVAGLKETALLWDMESDFLPHDFLTWGELTACLQNAQDSHKLTLSDIHVLSDSAQMTAGEKRHRMVKPSGITRDESGTLYIADSGNSMIAAMDSSGSIKTYAGSTSQKDIYQNAIGGYNDGSFLESAFSWPRDVYMTEAGLLVADKGNNAIRLLSGDTVYTYAGSKTEGHLDGYRTKALFNQPSAVTLDEKSNIYVSDTLNHCIRKIDAKGMVTTIAGTVGVAGFQDGEALLGKLSEPRGLTFKDGALYIADSGNQRIRVYQDGTLTTLAGGGEETYEGTDIIIGDYADGEAHEARFNDPQGVSFGTDLALYITDAGNAMIRKYEDGRVTTLVGAGLPVNALENKAENLICQPVGILALENQLIVTDQFTNRILSISLQ